MNQNILHVGLDVDDTQYHGSAFNKETGELIDFRCRPTLKGLLTQLDKLQRHFRGLSIRLCYEASYVGYCLQRDLRSHGEHCDVGAPSSIPSPRGKAVKTGEPREELPAVLVDQDGRVAVEQIVARRKGNRFQAQRVGGRQVGAGLDEGEAVALISDLQGEPHTLAGCHV